MKDIDGEIWIPIFRNYAVSNMGRVKSFYKRQPRILKLGNNGNGYMFAGINIEGRRINYYVHRLVADLFLKNTDPLKKTVNHHNGKNDNTHSSLSWMTQSENSKHGVENGLLPKGNKSYLSILDELQVQVIKSLKGDLKQKQIANYFNVTPSNIGAIYRGKSWKHVC